MALPSLENLRCFEVAARASSFRAAAREVGLTPAAFGQRIKQLEEELGAPLFVRTTRSKRLTTQGLALLPHACEVLVAAGACARAVRGEIKSPVHLTIGTRFELGLSWLLTRLVDVEALAPHLRLDFYFGSGPDLLLRLESGAIDCAITSARLPGPGLDSEVLEEERYLFVGSRERLAERPFRRRRDAERHVLLDVDPSLPLFRYLRDAPGLRGEMRFARHRYLGLGEAIRRFACQGEGVAVLPEYMVRDDLRLGRLDQILPSVALLHDHFRLVFRSDDLRRDEFVELADLLRSFPIRA